jgi:hypothetical protein
MSAHWPEMQENNAAFPRPSATAPKIEVGEFSYYNHADVPGRLETRNVLCTAGPQNG